ncbi:hypothetical protein ACMYR3_17040 (plasmid) [Ampullimonas aquatilis]|uniref:hypothetical protein n=1 Tax=Ampullimonas aquatilis TaxID=1341549 RepID=UPI003C7500C6
MINVIGKSIIGRDGLTWGTISDQYQEGAEGWYIVDGNFEVSTSFRSIDFIIDGDEIPVHFKPIRPRETA